MTKTCAMPEIRRHSLPENTFLLWNFVEVNLLIGQNEWSNKTFQTLDSKSKISLIILKGSLPYVLKNCMFMFIKHIIVRKAKWKIVKNFKAAYSSRGNCPNWNSPRLEISKVHLHWGSIILWGNCPRAIIWGNFPRSKLSGGQLSCSPLNGFSIFS